MKNHKRIMERASANLAASDNYPSTVANTVGFSPINGNLCRVRLAIACSQGVPATYLREVASECLAAGLYIVEGSFRALPTQAMTGSRTTQEYVGIIRKGINTKTVPVAEIASRFATVAKNVLMDSEDDSVWTLTAREGGKATLTRNVEEDFSELFALAAVQNSLNRNNKEILIPQTASAHYVSFFNPRTKSVDHGYTVGFEDNRDVVIASRGLDDLITISPEFVISSTNIHMDDEELQIRKDLHRNGVSTPPVVLSSLKACRASASSHRQYSRLTDTAALAPTTESPLDPNEVSFTDLRDYYRQVYAYAPDYYKEIEGMISQMGF